MSGKILEGGEEPVPSTRTVSRFREIMAQVLAISAANLIVLDMAINFFLTSIVISELHKSSAELTMDDTAASWYGGLPYMCQPIGSLASGAIVNWFGRKRSLMYLTIPYLLGCVLTSVSASIPMLYLSNIVIGITVGCTEAPINSYFGECCQPELRSSLAGSAALFYQFGFFLELTFGSLMHWRTAASVSCVFPIVTFFIIARIPESPIWLVAQGRKKDAEAALCWLRGWAEPGSVRKELDDLVSYHETVTMKTLPELHNLLDSKPAKPENVIVAKAKLLMEPETRRPLVLTFLLFVFSSMGGIFSIKAYIVGVLRNYHAPIDPKWSSVVVAAAGLAGSLFIIFTVRLLGKRKMSLITTALCILSTFILGLYAFLFIAPGGEDVPATWVPLLMFIVLSFASTVQCQVPWLLVAEAFPFRTRGIAGGMAAATMYIVAFVASKTYLMTEHALKLHGTYWFFCAINVVCFFYMYFQLPETEGKSLEEIEKLFAGNKPRRGSIPT